MSKSALFIPGKPSREKYFSPDYPNPSDDNWFPAVSRRFTLAGYDTRVLDMPTPYDPVYGDWEDEFHRFEDILESSDHKTFVGLSLGAGFLVKYALQYGAEADRLVLVAPYFDLSQKYSFTPDLLSIGAGALAKHVEVFYSSEDSQHILDAVEVLESRLPGDQITLRNIPEYGHYLWGNSMNHGNEFTELQPT